MKDIARELNLSITTVSFVVNGKSDSISAATVNKVKELIRQKGFNPNSAARMLRTGKSKTIGLIIEDNGNYFFGNIAKIIEKEARKNGYNVFLSSTDNNTDTAKDLIHKMKNSAVEGFIITATKGLKEEMDILHKENIPYVLLDRLIPEVESNYVVLNNYKGAYDLTKHLLNNGYEKIGFISIFDGMSQMIDRKKGFLDALQAADISIPKKEILELSFRDTPEDMLAAIKKFVARNPQLDALFFATNYLGVLGIEALQEGHIKIGEDIGVVSFDDNDLFRLLQPSITVAAQPIAEIATKSIQLLLKIISNEDKNTAFLGETIEPEIIIRNSSPMKMHALS